jgi:hypothetical protein
VVISGEELGWRHRARLIAFKLIRSKVFGQRLTFLLYPKKRTQIASLFD